MKNSDGSYDIDGLRFPVEIVDLIRQGRQIDAIRLIRELHDAPLVEAKRFADAIRDDLIATGEMPERHAKSGCGAALLVVGLGGLGCLSLSLSLFL